MALAKALVFSFCHSRIERHIDLQAFRARGFREALHAEGVEDGLDPGPDLTTLDDIGGSARIEVEASAVGREIAGAFAGRW